MMWAPVMAGYGSLDEVRYKWSIDDLAACQDVLAVKADSEAWAHEQAQQKRD